jgi:hypothetical protein
MPHVKICGFSVVATCDFPKVEIMGSNPITRSNLKSLAIRRSAMHLQLEQSNIMPQFLQAIKMVSELPKERQDELAQLLLEEIADLEWEDSPELHAAIEEAHAEYAAGNYITLEEYNRQRRVKGYGRYVSCG